MDLQMIDNLTAKCHDSEECSHCFVREDLIDSLKGRSAAQR